MPIKISSAAGGSAQLPAGVAEGVLRYTTDPVRIVASSAPPGGGSVVTINEENNTISVLVNYSGSPLETKTYTIPSATYPATLACLSTITGGPIDWSVESGKVVATLSRKYYLDHTNMSIEISGSALATLGFTDGQSATGDATRSWKPQALAADPEFESVKTRVSALESSVGTPPSLGVGVRQLYVPGAWLAPITGPTGAQAIGISGGSPRVAKIAPIFISRTIDVYEFGYEVAVAATSSRPYQVLLYSDAGHTEYDWPGEVVFRQTIESGTTTGFKTVTSDTPITLAPGLYFIGVGGYDFSGNTESSCTLVTNTGIGGIVPGVLGAGVGPSGVNGGRAASGIICTSWQDQVAAFPAPSGTGVSIGIQTPRVYMR